MNFNGENDKHSITYNVWKIKIPDGQNVQKHIHSNFVHMHMRFYDFKIALAKSALFGLKNFAFKKDEKYLHSLVVFVWTNIIWKFSFFCRDNIFKVYHNLRMTLYET